MTRTNDQLVPARMKDILSSVFQLMYPGQTYQPRKSTHKKFRLIAQVFLNREPEEIDWLDVCKYYEQSKNALFCLSLIVVLLERNLYRGSCEDALYRLRDIFADLVTPEKRKGTNWNYIFCGNDIEWLTIVPSKKYCYEYIFTKYKNSFLREIYAKSLAAERNHVVLHNQEVADLFEESLGAAAINICSYNDFNGQTFWAQIDFYRSKYQNDSKLRADSVASVYNFYRYLVNAYPEHSFFKDSINMSDSLLFSKFLRQRIEEGYYFTTFVPGGDLPKKPRLVVILRGLESMSTNFKREDWITINISELKSTSYQNAVINYISKNFSPSVLRSTNITPLVEALNFIYSIKHQNNYPNPNLFQFTSQEAVFIRKFYETKDNPLSTRNVWLGIIRRFLLWEQSIGEMTFDDLFFSYLSQFEEPSFSPGHSIPEEDLVKINQCLREMANENPVDRLVYVIFHLLLQTEFRISQICHLTIDCIAPSVKPNQYIIRSNSKTSHGRKESYVITSLTYHLLMDAIHETEELRGKCSVASNKHYIFLYQNKQRSFLVMDAKKFNARLKKCSDILQLSHPYNAQNLRDTHMTKAFEHILRSGKSDAELSILSRHKHINTTKNHYIEMQLEKMLEATYGIEIGGAPLIDASKNIVDVVPDDISGKSAIVENGCGNCTAKRCVMTSSLPCLACEHFVTTVAHEKYFIKAIEGVDLLIRSAQTKHDKDDLVTVKKLYVLYLKAIYARKGGIDCD